MAQEQNMEYKPLLIQGPIVASLVASVGTGIYIGYNHATGGDASLVAPAITTGIEALIVGNQANPRMNNPDAQEAGKIIMTSVGVGAGVVFNAGGYAIGYGIGYGINYVVPKIDYLINKLSFL